MLVLTRRKDESLIIGNDIKITVVNIDKTQIKLGIEAPKDVTINREEVQEKDL
jgi:carbon storage regulator